MDEPIELETGRSLRRRPGLREEASSLRAEASSLSQEAIRVSAEARERNAQALIENDQEIGQMQAILNRLARREDIPDDWWAAAGLTRSNVGTSVGGMLESLGGQVENLIGRIDRLERERL
jgi:hypothetical protein